MGVHLSVPRTEQQLLNYILKNGLVPLQKMVIWGIDLSDFMPFAFYRGYTVLQSLKLTAGGEPYFAIELIRYKPYELDQYGDKLAPCRIPVKMFENSKDELVCGHYRQCCNYKIGNCFIGDLMENKARQKQCDLYARILFTKSMFSDYSNSIATYYTSGIEIEGA